MKLFLPLFFAFVSNLPLTAKATTMGDGMEGGSSSTASGSCSADPIWSDEFDTFSSEYWNYDTGKGINGWGNSELQYYTDSEDNVYVNDGMLHIAVRKLEDGNFTSGRVNTLDKVSFKYGCLVAKISWPDVVEGLWPAFWTLGASFPEIQWPTCGEIDLLESGQGNGLKLGKGNQRIVPAVHWEDEFMTDPANPLKIATHKIEYDHPTNLSGTFHEYKLEWTPSLIEMFLDGTSIYALDISETSCPACTELREPHSLVTNIAVGGGFTSYSDSHGCGESSGGTECSSLRTEEDISAPTPAIMMIDYVRIYANEHTELTIPPTTTSTTTTTTTTTAAATTTTTDARSEPEPTTTDSSGAAAATTEAPPASTTTTEASNPSTTEVAAVSSTTEAASTTGAAAAPSTTDAGSSLPPAILSTDEPTASPKARLPAEPSALPTRSPNVIIIAGGDAEPSGSGKVGKQGKVGGKMGSSSTSGASAQSSSSGKQMMGKGKRSGSADSATSASALGLGEPSSGIRAAVTLASVSIFLAMGMMIL